MLGRAGSGKTWRCLAEIREALLADPAGPPLLLIAPKQATFQLEYQLLAPGGLEGYTRLQIASFDRLAQFILSEVACPAPLLDEEGRVMVLRAILGRLEREKRLRLFHSTARLPGFARQLSLLLREAQRRRLSPGRLALLAAEPGLPPALASKLADVARVFEAYLEWLSLHRLEDPDRLLDLATEALRTGLADRADLAPGSGAPWRLGGLWMDGFAEMTPQELELLAALVPYCERVTLAFCLDGEPREDPHWLSTWSVVARTCRQCLGRLRALDRCRIEVERIAPGPEGGRFAANPALSHLERAWPGESAPSFVGASDSIRLAPCANPEGEATLAAHEILRWVRAGGRYRDCAVLVRSLETHHQPLRRVFSRYGVPCFVDRREPLAHHPLAELTRGALRLAAGGWRREDWFGLLKCGLLPAADEEIDWLENAALEHGWEADFWRGQPGETGRGGGAGRAGELRARLTGGFLKFEAALGGGGAALSGGDLAAALRALWSDLRVAEVLERWSVGDPEVAADSGLAGRAAVHRAVWEQMQEWLDNLERAFQEERMSLREWLPVVEAGLGALSAGVIPPAMDQVLVGAVDRSRNPELGLLLALGFNEGLFPSPPALDPLFHEADREELERRGVVLGANRKVRLGHERYLGYIACTRARRRLVLSWSQADADGNELKPSLFVASLKRLFPDLKEEPFQAADPVASLSVSPEGTAGEPGWTEAVHPCELEPAVLANAAAQPGARVSSLAACGQWPCFRGLLARRALFRQPDVRLGVAALDRLLGRQLVASISALEDYAACPFRFLAARILRAEERKEFQIDESAPGAFQHEALKLFHQRLQSQGRLWRHLSAIEARQIVRQEAESLAPVFRQGLFAADPAGRFQASLLIQQLENLVEVLVGWAPQYGFDPVAVEWGFGFTAESPPWRIDLGQERFLLLRGFIDRVDVHRLPDGQTALAAVVDYKSTVHPLDPVRLHHGLQLQLPSYLGVLRRLERAADRFGAARLLPAGMFYVGLRGRLGSRGSRAEAMAELDADRRRAFQHAGRFDARWRTVFDLRPDARSGEQFRWRLNKDGRPSKSGNEALPAAEFETLLNENEERLKRFGREIFAGAFPASPFRHRARTACDYCAFRALCRFDPWTDPYRVLRPPGGAAAAPSTEAEP